MLLPEVIRTGKTCPHPQLLSLLSHHHHWYAMEYVNTLLQKVTCTGKKKQDICEDVQKCLEHQLAEAIEELRQKISYWMMKTTLRCFQPWVKMRGTQATFKRRFQHIKTAMDCNWWPTVQVCDTHKGRHWTNFAQCVEEHYAMLWQGRFSYCYLFTST